MKDNIQSRMFCTNCGKENISIWRTGNAREAGHLKKLWCPWCQEEHNAVECKEFTKYDVSDFNFEYNNGNFDKNGNRKMTYSQLKEMINNEK